MYMRMLQVTANPDKVAELQMMYEREVMPRLQVTPGCLYVGLTKSVRDAYEYISLTLWESPKHAEDYERSGVFAELLKGAEPYLAGTSEWRLHLSQDNVLEYEPVPTEPVIHAYSIAEKSVSKILPKQRVSPLFVRIVSPQIRPGMVEEFKRIYTAEVIPVLRMAEGCLYAALTESANDSEHPISLTVWNSLLDAERYEQSGAFASLTAKVTHTFSGVYQWKMQLEKETKAHTTTSDDVAVSGYQVVTGKAFR
jgi:heme-degrading monooxygenase HmoA